MLRISEQMWASLVQRLLDRNDVETAAIVMAESLGTEASGPVLAAREVKFVPDDGYLIREIDQIRIDPVAINRLIRPARDRGMSVITVHSHPGAREAWFSQADDRGDGRLLPSFAAQVPHVSHGAMVLAGSGAAVGRLLTDGTLQPMPLRIVGRQLTTIGSALVVEPDERFARQVLAIGDDGQRLLRGLRVGVVGLGGIGSVVAAQLVHLGIGTAVFVDGDRVEASNMSRVIGVRHADVGVISKVEVARRYARELGSATEIECFEQYLTRPDDVRCLVGCDVIICCVDRHTPRALLNRFAYKALVPVIDLGTAFRVDTTGTMTGSAGRVVIVGPGRPCLACWGHIDPAALRREALSESERAAEAADGYVDGAEVPQPSVIPFNTMAAGAGVIELLRLVTGFAGTIDPPQRLALRFDEGDVRRNRLAGDPRCTSCGSADRAEPPMLIPATAP